MSCFESLMDDDSIVANKLALLASNLKRQVYGVLDFFFSFLTKYENNKAHNMDSLMLDPRFKNLHIIFSFVRKEQNVLLVEKYDKMSLYPMLVKCHEHLHPSLRLDRNYSNQEIVVWRFLSKLVEKLVKRGLLIFRQYQFNVKTSNVLFNGGKNIKQCFFYCWFSSLPIFLHCWIID